MVLYRNASLAALEVYTLDAYSTMLFHLHSVTISSKVNEPSYRRAVKFKCSVDVKLVVSLTDRLRLSPKGGKILCNTCDKKLR